MMYLAHGLTNTVTEQMIRMWCQSFHPPIISLAGIASDMLVDFGKEKIITAFS